MLSKHGSALLALVALISTTVRADMAIDIHDPWIRHIPGDRPMAGYFVLENKGDTHRRVTGASSALFDAVHLHESVEQDGTAIMRPVESVDLPALGRIEFVPGGYHLMLMQRREHLEVDDKVPVTLEFEDGGTQNAVFIIKPTWQE